MIDTNNLQFMVKPVKLRLKIDLESYPAQVEGEKEEEVPVV